MLLLSNDIYPEWNIFMSLNFNEYLLEVSGATACRELEVIQSLWSGYGKISRYQLDGGIFESVVVKCISLKQSSIHPRGWGTDYSHNRKVKSYEVEIQWYEVWSQGCTDSCRVPQFIGSLSKGNEQWIVLEDLDTCYPIRKKQIGIEEVKVCLKWLANFHATFLHQKPVGLWEIGTYWNLATRPNEFEKIEHPELKAKAHLIDAELNDCMYQTIVHGDAKLANFCFSEDGKKVAGVDFQYVGGGCGIKDVAYFLGSWLTGSESELYEKELLDFYFEELRRVSEMSIDNIDSEELEKEWRKMYPVACADFTRFLLGWMPTHQKINDYQLGLLASVLSNL